MKRIGVIGTTGGWSSELLADTVSRHTGFRLLIDMDKIRFDITSGKAWFGDVDLSQLDALVIKKIGARYSPDLLDRLECLRLLHENGLPVFSKPISIIRVLDRLSCTITLRSGGIPMPPTTITEDVDAARIAVETYGEAVFKPLYTSKARGMTVIRADQKNPEEAIRAFKAQNRVMYIQKKIEHNGKDLGIVFLGGEYVTTYARCGDGSSWNTTTRSGGKYAPYDPSPEIIGMARKAQNLFDLDFTCVDVVETDDGPMVFEVSAFGGFKGIQTARNIDAASEYARYVIEKIS